MIRSPLVGGQWVIQLQISISASMSLVTRLSSKWIEVCIPYRLHQLMLLLLSPFGALMVWVGEGGKIRARPILLGLCCCELGLDLGGGSGGDGGWGDVELISSPFWTHSGGRNTNKTKIIMAITCPLPWPVKGRTCIPILVHGTWEVPRRMSVKRSPVLPIGVIILLPVWGWNQHMEEGRAKRITFSLPLFLLLLRGQSRGVWDFPAQDAHSSLCSAM